MLDSASLPWRLPGGWPRGCQYTRRDWTSTTGPLYSRRHAQVAENRQGVLWASLTESQQDPVATRVPPFFLTGVLIPKPPVSAASSHPPTWHQCVLVLIIFRFLFEIPADSLVFNFLLLSLSNPLWWGWACTSNHHLSIVSVAFPCPPKYITLSLLKKSQTQPKLLNSLSLLDPLISHLPAQGNPLNKYLVNKPSPLFMFYCSKAQWFTVWPEDHRGLPRRPFSEVCEAPNMYLQEDTFSSYTLNRL